MRSSLPRPAPQDYEPTNIRLPRVLKQEIARLAVERYGLDLTNYTRAIFRREATTKGGILYAKLKAGRPSHE